MIGTKTDVYKNISKKQLKDLLTEPQRFKIPIPIPRSKVSKPIPLLGFKKQLPLPRHIPLQRTKKPTSSL